MRYQPKVYKLKSEITGAYMSDSEGLILTGTVEEEDTVHNCDYAGCTSVSCVVYRYGEPQVEVEIMEGMK